MISQFFIRFPKEGFGFIEFLARQRLQENFI
jgi:hypothetical protein